MKLPCSQKGGQHLRTRGLIFSKKFSSFKTKRKSFHPSKDSEGVLLRKIFQIHTFRLANNFQFTYLLWWVFNSRGSLYARQWQNVHWVASAKKHSLKRDNVTKPLSTFHEFGDLSLLKNGLCLAYALYFQLTTA